MFTESPAPDPLPTFTFRDSGTHELAAARNHVRTVLADQPESVTVDVVLIVDVLLSEAIRWCHSLHALRLDHSRDEQRLHIELWCSDSFVMPTDLATAERYGRLLLEELATTWSTAKQVSALIVRAEVDVPPQAVD